VEREPNPAKPDQITEKLAPSGGAGSPPVAALPTDLPRGPWQRRYQPVREIARGGMGVVLLVRSVADSSLACLKLLHPDTDRRSMEQECRALMRLRHPNIVSLLGYAFDEDPPWMAMEFVEGETLEGVLRRNGPIHSALTAVILRQILRALDHAHSEDVIHRDVKPANIMIQLTEAGARVRMLDFGIAIVEKLDYQQNLTGVGNMEGTSRYMAPEQYSGALLTPACDVYAAGLIGWRMLIGKYPFEGLNIAATMHRKMTAVEGFEVELPDLPPSLSAVIRACTRTDPAARPSARGALNLLDH
jgi:serine/threonine-protein kinase